MHRTPLYPCHVAKQCKFTQFSEWEMPLHYGSQLEEHHAVRKHAGVFDVSHMMITDISGKDSQQFLSYLLANDINRLEISQGMYTCLLNESGGIIDDAIIYRLTPAGYRLVSNAGTRASVKAWLQKQAQGDVALTFRDDLAILALQGPSTPSLLDELKLPYPKHAFQILPLNEADYIARTGYTGEAGVEIMIDPMAAIPLFEKLLQMGAQACGLGARDSLRLEMGYGLNGVDMTNQHTPLESNLGWTVKWDPKRDFMGKAALEKQKNTQHANLTGLILDEPGVPRSHYPVYNLEKNKVIGEVTSGGFSPTLNKGIALVRLHENTSQACYLKIREHWIPATLVKPPFLQKRT